MGSESQWVTVGSRKLELSNLDKVLFPGSGITKAEVISYYLEMAPVLLSHIRGRPLTLIRYPDGIEKQRFYQKNTPGWAPEWVESVVLGEEKKNYVLANEPATLAWLANLAALELHQMHSRGPQYDRPDYMVFDLDPPEGTGFEAVADTAFRLRRHIEDHGYRTFVKTTGGKGLHLVVPLEPVSDRESVFEASKEIARSFVAGHREETTLQIRKKARQGRMLIDIYRNRSSQTIVCPYSLRGRPGAPVSMPVEWDELGHLESSGHFRLRDVPERIASRGDAWEGIGGYSVMLHDRRQKNNPPKERSGSAHTKSPEQLSEYAAKRDFARTPEPAGSTGEPEGSRFVVHRHHATRLHYDLRLEREGVLRSWAVPKGLPPRPGVKRLAVQTEDHPVEYLDFEGSIPRHEYGGGDMWIFARGRYRILREKKNGFYFRLESPQVSGEYRIHKMKENEWLLEKTEEPQKDWLLDPVDPMHGERESSPPEGDYLYEVKWDGIRALIAFEEGEIRIRSRNRNDITDRFPELQEASGAFRAACGLFDGEIVSLDENGTPSFQAVIQRLKTSGSSPIAKMARKYPVHCYLFDCLYLDGRVITGEPLVRRRVWLEDSLKKGFPYRISESVEDGLALFEAARKHNLEGIMAKKRDGRYVPGRRSDLWVKVKVQHTVDCRVIGYTTGRGERNRTFGALHLAEETEEGAVYRGKVGTGFTGRTAEEITEVLEALERTGKPDYDHVPDDPDTVWVEPEVYVEVSYGRLSDNGLFKEAVYVRMRPDLSA